MELKDKIIVITGAAGGIGRAMAERFTAEAPKLIVCADKNEAQVREAARSLGCEAFRVDVSQENELRGLIDTVEEKFGAIDLFCSNAGIGLSGGMEIANADWQRIWDINVMAHVWAARHLVPRMVARGGGYLLSTASAAGLLSQVGSAPYAVTKHAAVALAEWLAITHGDDGLKVSVLCPQAVRTAMTAGDPNGVASLDGMMEPAAVAEQVVRSLAAEEFLILPHPEVLGYMRNKTADYERWLGCMRKLNRRFGRSSPR